MVHLEKSVRKGDREIPSGDHLRIARTGQDSRSHQFVREPGKLEPGIVVQRARMVSRSAEYLIQLRRIPVSMLVAPEGERAADQRQVVRAYGALRAQLGVRQDRNGQRRQQGQRANHRHQFPGREAIASAGAPAMTTKSPRVSIGGCWSGCRWNGVFHNGNYSGLRLLSPSPPWRGRSWRCVWKAPLLSLLPR